MYLNTLVLPSTLRASTRRRPRPWSGASPPAAASSTPSTFSSWRWLTTARGIASSPRLFDRAVHWLGQQKSLSDKYTKELAVLTPAEAVLAGPAGELPANVFANHAEPKKGTAKKGVKSYKERRQEPYRRFGSCPFSSYSG